MAQNGVTTENIGNHVSVAKEVVVNGDNGTGLQSFGALAQQLSGTGAVANRLNVLDGRAFTDAVIHNSVAAGLAATAIGGEFKVKTDNPGLVAYYVYQNVAGSGVLISEVPAGTALGTKQPIGTATIAAAATTNIGALDASDVVLEGVADIASLGNAMPGTRKVLRCAATPTFVHGASLVLAGSENYTAKAGSSIEFQATGSEGATVWRQLLPSNEQLGLDAKFNLDAADTLRKSVDLLDIIVWNPNTLLYNTGVPAAFSGYQTSDPLNVSGGEVLAYNGGGNHSAQAITVAAYDGAGVFLSALYSGAVPADPKTGLAAENVQFIDIPANARSIRFGQQNPSKLTRATLISAPAQYAEAELTTLTRSSARSNLLEFGRFYPGATGAVSTNAGFKGSGWVPVSYGDEIAWNLATAGGVYGLAIYDETKTLIRFLESNASSILVEKRHVINEGDDPGAAYIVAGHYSSNAEHLAAGYIYVSSQNSLDRRIEDVKSGPVMGRGVKKIRPGFSSSIAGQLTLSYPGDGVTRVTVNNNPAYLAINRVARPLEKEFSGGRVKGVRAYKVKIVSLPEGETEATVYWNGTQTDAYGYAPAFSAPVTLAEGEEALMWVDSYDTAHLRCDLVGVVYDVLWAVEWQFSQATRDTLEDHHIRVIGESAQALEPRFGVTDLALRATEAHYLRSWAHGRKGAFFGNSLQYQMWPMLAKYLGCEMTDLTDGGSSAQENLTDVRLSAIPADVDFVTISSGSGSATGSLSPASASYPWAGYHGYLSGFGTDITSRDRTTSEGAINYAIDWISTNRPAARIVLIGPAYCGYQYRDNSKWQALFEALAAYRLLPLSDVFHNADLSARNWAPTGGGLFTHDGIHLTDAGKERQAGVIAATFRSLSL
ncbi:MAG: hypothetical protein ABGX47_08065 [Martelella sp.]|uniref:hypothetical protein n=1 Tax=Martelella sp. TaxID=1969699 RepID=UPI003242D9AC